MSSIRLSVARTALAAGLAAAAAFGQVSAVRSGSFEIGPFAGAGFGGGLTDVVAGGNVTYALKNKYVLPYFEYSYFLLPPVRAIQGAIGGGGGTFTAATTAAASDIHGGVHIRIPVFKESRFVPYAVFGMGVLHYAGNTGTATLVGPFPITVLVPFPGGTDFTVNGGGGLRYYIGRTGKFGFRTEAKVYHPTSGAFSTFAKVEAGFFFQLR